jgi:chromosome segregation ATPase
MFSSCRVYNLKTLAQLFQTTEVALRFLMLSLLDKDIVRKKEFNSKSGKTKELYWANQDSNAKEIQKLTPTSNDIKTAQQQFTLLSQEYDNLCKELTVLTEQLGNDEINSRIHELEAKVQSLRNEQKECHARIEAFSMSASHRSNLNRGASSDKNELDNDPNHLIMRIQAMREQWQSRKIKCMDFVDQLADGMEKKPRDIIKLLDIETDEMASVIMPPKRTLTDAKISRSTGSQTIRK